MKTAAHERVLRSRTFLRTLLHEVTIFGVVTDDALMLLLEASAL